MNFTEKYFNEEIGRFRQMMSDPKFWQKDEEIRERAIQGLNIVYLSTSPTDVVSVQRRATLYSSTMMEYNRRGTMMILQPFRDSRPNCPVCQRPHGVARDIDGVFRCHMVDHVVPVDCENSFELM